MLGHQLPHLPPFADFWAQLDELFGWLRGQIRASRLPRAQMGRLDEAWRPSPGMAAWRRGAPIELIRFAGANRLLVEIDYRAARGRHGPRVVEPYSLRRSSEGHILLFVVNDRGQLRSYRIDHIAGVRVLDRTFAPRLRVEF